MKTNIRNIKGIEKFINKSNIQIAAAPCPRCGGYGTFKDGSICYYCNGKGTV